MIVIGGRNSNNTRQLTEKATRLGARAHQIETPDDLREEWFAGVGDVGITAGTSTLDETVTAVMDRLRQMKTEN
jgi:4-hydroxy-3-methylbut-2-enyl diphosphate reductase